ncbi:hypothetical protein BGZ60DRAFT_76451 [Tricladium varicosporioides]|nr:hypothetical protein BGZ60DRAFT_76451 [Hymenoscyphus varicosporioides]
MTYYPSTTRTLVCRPCIMPCLLAINRFLRNTIKQNLGAHGRLQHLIIVQVPSRRSKFVGLNYHFFHFYFSYVHKISVAISPRRMAPQEHDSPAVAPESGVKSSELQHVRHCKIKDIDIEAYELHSFHSYDLYYEVDLGYAGQGPHMPAQYITTGLYSTRLATLQIHMGKLKETLLGSAGSIFQCHRRSRKNHSSTCRPKIYSKIQ